MNPRSLLPPLMALLIFAAHTHCMVSHGSSLQQQMSASQDDSTPAGEESSCENESACICKGAVLSAVQLDLPPDLVLYQLVLAAGETGAIGSIASSCDSFPPAAPPAPLAGEMLRANLQVFLL